MRPLELEDEADEEVEEEDIGPAFETVLILLLLVDAAVGTEVVGLPVPVSLEQGWGRRRRG